MPPARLVPGPKRASPASQVAIALFAVFIACGLCNSCGDGSDDRADHARVVAVPDSVALAADSLEEARLYEAARAIPGSDYEGNRRAYSGLAARYPDNPEYARKRDQYDERIAARAAAATRAAERAAYTPRRSGGARSGGRGRYIRGPRGGCYYINGNGNKTYVERSLCG